MIHECSGVRRSRRGFGRCPGGRCSGGHRIRIRGGVGRRPVVVRSSSESSTSDPSPSPKKQSEADKDRHRQSHGKGNGTDTSTSTASTTSQVPPESSSAPAARTPVRSRRRTTRSRRSRGRPPPKNAPAAEPASGVTKPKPLITDTKAPESKVDAVEVEVDAKVRSRRASRRPKPMCRSVPLQHRRCRRPRRYDGRGDDGRHAADGPVPATLVNGIRPQHLGHLCRRRRLESCQRGAEPVRRRSPFGARRTADGVGIAGMGAP